MSKESEHEARFVEAAVAAFKAELGAAIAQMRKADSPSSFCNAERELHRLTRTVANEITRQVLQDLSSDDATRDRAAIRVREKAAAKSIQMRKERDRETEVRTLGGQHIRVKTPYMRALPRGGGATVRGRQGTGVYPVLDMFGIVGRSTPALRLQVAHAVVEANSVTSAREVLELGGTEIGHKAALRLTYLACDDALRARHLAVQKAKTGNERGEFVGLRVAVAVDGGRVNIRRRVAGRPKKGGRKRFVSEWREPKVLTVYALNDDGERDKRHRVVLDGTLGGADSVFELLTYHLLRLGVHLAQKVVFLGDGATWIWNRTGRLREALGMDTEQFTEVLDYFHVVERLTELAAKKSRWTPEQRTAWVEEQKSKLKDGEASEVAAAAVALVKRNKQDRETEAAYWTRNRDRLGYGACREANLPIGSGAVESAVRRVVNLRMKSASVLWTEDHAEGILHLRAHAKAGRWDELELSVLGQTGWRPTARRTPKAA
jgi:hypothetical protein